jgi:hypothetical protein
MPASFKPPGPPGVRRPSSPMINENAWSERVARALEQIAVTLSDIDDKLDAIADRSVTKANN